MNLEVLSPGLFTTIQDRGRFGYIASGIGVSGALDQDAYAAANYLVGNKHHEAVLESTILGPSIRFDADCICVVTGANMEPKIGNKPVAMYQPFWVQAGQTLSLGTAINGCRSYLAVQGGFDVPMVLGSRSTNLKCNIGGYEGRPLRCGDALTVPDKSNSTVMDRKLRPSVYQPSVTVRVISGPQVSCFSEAGFRTLWTHPFSVSGAGDRMGIRLDGPVIETVGSSDIISDGIAPGSIQVTSSGQPIILLADRQTTGGYAKIGTVCSFDLPLLAQV